MTDGGAGSMTDGVVHRRDVPIAVRDHGGDGPPVVLLHGAGRTLTDWSGMVPYLVPTHRVIAADLRSHGLSGDGPWTWDAVVGDVEDIVAEFRLEQPAVVGHSLGGMIAAQYGARHADCAGVVNLDGHGRGRPEQYLGLDPAVVATRLAAQRTRRTEARLRHGRALTAEQLSEMTDALVGEMRALGLPPRYATDAIGRSLAAHPDGAFTLRPSAARAEEISERIDELDLFEIYRVARCPLAVYLSGGRANEQLSADPDWYTEMLAALRAGLRRDLLALEADSDDMRFIEVDATHGLIAEIPEAIAGQIVEFLDPSRAGARQRPGG